MVVLLKGAVDKILAPKIAPIEISGGVPGMTKGGTRRCLGGAGCRLVLQKRCDYLGRSW